MLSGERMKILYALTLLPLLSYGYEPTNISFQDNIQRYFWANYKQFEGEDTQRWYDSIFEDNGPIEAYKGYIHSLHKKEAYKKIEPLIPKLDSHFSNDPRIQYIFVKTLEKLGKQQEADKRIIALADQFKTNQEIVFHAAYTYIRRKELNNALSVIDNLLNNASRTPNDFIFYFLKAQIYTQLNKKEEALVAIKKSLEIKPGFDKAWFLYAVIEEQMGNLDEAIKGYSLFLELTGSNSQLEQHLLNLIFKQKTLQKNKTNIDSSWFQKAQQLFKQKKYKEALQEINGYLHEKPHDKEGRLLKIQILSARRDYKDALSSLKTLILEDPNDEMWYTTLHFSVQTGTPTKLALSALHDIEQQNQTSIFPKLYLADMYVHARKTNKAITYLKKALTLTKDSALQTKIYYQLGLLYHHKQQFSTMRIALEQGRKLNHDFLPLLNMLAHYYAEKGNNIKEAQNLMNIILEKEKNNPHFLDTQAYIFFKQKKYDEALHILHKLAFEIPTHISEKRKLKKCKSLWRKKKHEPAHYCLCCR